MQAAQDKPESGDRGAVLLEVIIALFMLAVSIPSFFVVMTLSSFHSVEARANIMSFAVAQYEFEWLQANCADYIMALFDDGDAGGDDGGEGDGEGEGDEAGGGGDDGIPPEIAARCEVLMSGAMQAVPEEHYKGMHGMRYNVTIAKADSGDELLDLAEVKVYVEWDRVFLMDAPGHVEYIGLIFSSREGDLEWGDGDGP